MSSFRKDLHAVSKDMWNILKETFKWLHVHKIIKDSKNENVPCSKIDEVTIQAVVFSLIILCSFILTEHSQLSWYHKTQGISAMPGLQRRAFQWQAVLHQIADPMVLWECIYHCKLARVNSQYNTDICE